jgi:hypothetical protein
VLGTGALSAAAAARFFTVTPCRALDTRATTPLLANAARSVPLAGVCGVPPSAATVAANVTIVAPSGAGSLVVFPAGGANPGTSTLNFRAGATRANNAHLVLGQGGAASFLLAGPAGGTAQLLVDVLGYYQGDATSFSIGGAAVVQRFNNAGPANGTLTTSSTATATGSLLLCSIARGAWANAPSGPSDNRSNSYSILGTTHTYAAYPQSQTGVYRAVNLSGSPSHTFSAAWGAAGGGGGGDEVTISAVEVRGATSVTATTHVERTAAPTLQGLPTSIAGPGVFVSFCWGNGPVGITHDFRPGAGWTRINAASAIADPNQSGYIQVAVAYRIATAAGTETVTWSNVNTNEGAQIYTIALR